MAVTGASTETLQTIGEGLRGARQDVHDLKTFIMEMEDRINGRFDKMDGRFDKMAEHVSVLALETGRRFDTLESRFDDLEKLIRG